LDLGIIGDVKATLSALVPLLDQKEDDTHLKTFIHQYQDTRKGLDELAVGHPGRKPMHPQYVAKTVDDIAAEDAIFSCDVGTPTVWAARYRGIQELRIFPASGVKFGWNFFVGTQGRAVAWNIFLDDNTFQNSRSVVKEPVVADLIIGAELSVLCGLADGYPDPDFPGRCSWTANRGRAFGA
jgi:Uncharacterized protein conserved in bacteria (DUF2219)